VLREDDVQRILVVTAHPDDVDFGAAGTVATWTDAGIEVTYCIVTDGDAGGFDPDVPRIEIPRIRRAEQTAAAAVVGVTDLEFLGYPDGRLLVSMELRRDISRVIRRVRPQRVVCQSPERAWDRLFASHPDHLAAGEATVCAVYPDSRNAFAFPELLADGFDPWTVSELWVMATDEPNRYVDISGAVDRKLVALGRHESQHTDPAAMEDRVRSWVTANGTTAGFGPGRSAEAFRVVQTG
jgi:LmbE family N-acetylglucosaminyl deacetylase